MKTLLTAIAGVIALASLFHGIDSAPLKRDPTADPKEKAKALTFLVDFGYLDKSKIISDGDSGQGNQLDSPAVVHAITDLQIFGNLAVTGKLNRETLELLNTKRCGLKDPVNKLNVTLKSAGGLTVGRYYLQGTYWKKKDLTYRFISLTSDMERETQKNILRKMIQKWAAVSTLTITEQNDPAVSDDDVDILIKFVRRYHGDPYAFDGQGGTLAHAYYPHNNKGLSGDAHFDDDERFTTGTSDGINLDWVAVHEFGHSMGLEHSNVRESIMYPWYKGYFPNIELTYDDIQGIQALYGKPPINPTDPPTDPTTDPPTGHPACRPGTTYDAVVVEEDTSGSQFTHFFHGDSFWTLSRRLQKSQAKKVKDYYPEVRTPISAAYRNKQGYVVIFSGSRFWEYEKPLPGQHNKRRRLRRLSSGEIRSGYITKYGLSSSLSNMDAVFTWEGNKKTYIFKGSQYWRYNEDTRSIDNGYPRPIQRGWPSLPNDLDAAVTWSNGFSYVFKGNDYWKLNKSSQRGKVYAVGGYPRKVTSTKGWMKCKTDSVGALGVGAIQVDP